MSRRNPANNPSDFHEEFVKTGSVTIRNFLTDDYAEALRKFFKDDMPADWWYSSSYPGHEGQIHYVRNYEHDQGLIELARLDANRNFIQGNFSYFFYRTTGNHVPECWCAECDLRTWLKSEEILQFIEKVSGISCSTYDTLFASKYSEGCFLSPHHDQNLGNVGFVLQLTKDWKPEWGGLLHFMTDDRSTITGTEIPTFNSLTLFYLPDEKGVFHYVSHVNPGVKESRLAYTGWYRK